MLKQTNLFTDLIPNGNLKIHQQGKQITEAAIEKAVNHANEVSENWSQKAYELLCQYIKTNDNFMAEDFRQWCRFKIDSPPSLRAYGGIILRAAREGLIIKNGYAQVKNLKAHRANAGVWRVNND